MKTLVICASLTAACWTRGQTSPAPDPFTAPSVEGTFVDSPVIQLKGGHALETLKIGSDVTTVVVFPEPVTLLTGHGLAADAEKAAALAKAKVTLAQFESVGPDSLAFRLLQSGAKPCIATVRYGKTGVALLRLTPSETPDVLAMVGSAGGGMAAAAGPSLGGQAPAVRALEEEQVTEARIDYSSDELIGILCRAKERKFLERVNPSLYAGWTERNGLKLTAMSGPIASTITEIQRWAEKDAVILTGMLQNTGDKPYSFDPKDVLVRLGQRVYPAQFVDCSGRVPPGGAASIAVILQGNVAGGRENLSVDNDYHLQLPTPGGNSAAAPAAAIDPLAPAAPGKGVAAFPFERIYGAPWPHQDAEPELSTLQMAQQ
jgi:hypothetical protein